MEVAMGDIRERLRELKDRIIPRKLGYVEVPISDDEKEKYGNFQAYIPLKHAKKFGLGDSRELDSFDFAYGSIEFYKREKPKFDGIILDSAHNNVQDAEKAMEYIAEKYRLPVSSRLNGRFVVKDCNHQGLSNRGRLD